MNPSQPIQPTAANERIDVLDILRGFALLGILLVNMGIFSFPFIAQFTGTPRGEGALDRVAEFVISWLATGKFYPLFAFLFGLGMTLQMARIQERGGRVGRFMARRLFFLMLFGLAHALLIWNGDILFIYALIGFVFLLFRNVQPKTLLVWVVVLFAIPVLFSLLGAASTAMFAPAMTTSGASDSDASSFDMDAFFADWQNRTIQTYRSGTWGEIFVLRAIEWAFALTFGLFGSGLQILALFLLGMVFGKHGIFENQAEHLALFQRWLRIGLGVGLPANFIIAWMTQAVGDFTSPLPLLASALLLAFGPVLTFGYISAFVLLTQDEAWRKRLAPLAAVGRMALSNYLAQSIVCTLIFYSYGLGLFGQVGAFAGLVLSVVIWLVQLPISMLWLSRFRFGPLEWLWRTLTYGKPQPMVRSAAPSPALS